MTDPAEAVGGACPGPARVVSPHLLKVWGGVCPDPSDL